MKEKDIEREMMEDSLEYFGNWIRILFKEEKDD